jgi:hypothetical protein
MYEFLEKKIAEMKQLIETVQGNLRYAQGALDALNMLKQDIDKNSVEIMNQEFEKQKAQISE